MNTPASLHKLTVLSQLLDELRAHTLAAQNKIIKSAGEEDLRYMLLNRYPLRLNVMPDTMAGLIRELEKTLRKNPSKPGPTDKEVRISGGRGCPG